MANAVVNITTATTTAVIAGVAKKTIRIHGYAIMAGDTNNVTLKDGTTALTGPFPLAAQAGAVAPYAQDGWFDLTQGNAFNITTDAAHVLSGHVRYEMIG